MKNLAKLAGFAWYAHTYLTKTYRAVAPPTAALRLDWKWFVSLKHFAPLRSNSMRLRFATRSVRGIFLLKKQTTLLDCCLRCICITAVSFSRVLCKHVVTESRNMKQLYQKAINLDDT